MLWIQGRPRPVLYHCAVCDRKFRSFMNGVHHYCEHFSLTQCTACKEWVARADWDVHKAVFHKPLVYQCVYCGKTYSKKQSLDVHLAARHIGPHYRCTKCTRIYSSLTAFRAHRCVAQRRPILQECSTPHSPGETARPEPTDRRNGPKKRGCTSPGSLAAPRSATPEVDSSAGPQGTFESQPGSLRGTAKTPGA